jgi:hypothetical protein
VQRRRRQRLIRLEQQQQQQQQQVTASSSSSKDGRGTIPSSSVQLRTRAFGEGSSGELPEASEASSLFASAGGAMGSEGGGDGGTLSQLTVGWVTTRGALNIWSGDTGVVELVRESGSDLNGEEPLPFDSSSSSASSFPSFRGVIGAGSLAEDDPRLSCGVAFCERDEWLLAWGRHIVTAWRRNHRPTDDQEAVAVATSGGGGDNGDQEEDAAAVTTMPSTSPSRAFAARAARQSDSLKRPYLLALRVDLKRRGNKGGAVASAHVRRGRLLVTTKDGWCFDYDLAVALADDTAAN